MASATEAPARAEGPTSHTLFPDDGPLYSREEQLKILEALRAPFLPEEISVRPAIKCNPCENSPSGVCPTHYKVRCSACGLTITAEHKDLSFVGHAEATSRILDVDPLWGWKPLAVDNRGLPALDEVTGGMWIRLTIGGITRLGYGDAHGRPRDGNAVKEIIGDAIRNGAMRFGMALDLWKKQHDAEPPERIPVSIPAAGELRLRELVGYMRSYWGQLDKLRNVLQWVAEEGFAESQIPAGTDWILFGPVLTDRIAELERQHSVPPAGPYPAAVQQHPAAPPEDASQDTGAPAPGEEPEDPADDAAPDEPHREPSSDGPPPAAGDPETVELNKLTNQARDFWNKPVVLEQVRGAARTADLLDHNVQGPPEWGSGWMGFGVLLDRRLEELKTTADDTTGRAA